MSNPNEVRVELPIVYFDPSELIPYERNAKIHSEEQVAKIAESIALEGFDQPIVIDPQKVIVKGHGRRLAALKLGLTRVPCVLKDHLEAAQLRAARIRDNEVAKAPWDMSVLRVEFGDLSNLPDFKIETTGFSMPQIADLLRPPTSDEVYKDHDSGIKKDYDDSDVRQIVLVMDPPTFDRVMNRLVTLQEKYELETNTDVFLKLMDLEQGGEV